MAEFGYQRNSKKCKEKFENVYKYHKRTKEGRGGKSDGKTYRFFDQLQALENNPSIQIQPSPTPSKLPPPQLNNSTSSLPSQSLPISTTSTTTMPLLFPPPLLNTTPPSTIPSTITTTLPISSPQIQGIVNTPSINLTNPTYFPTTTTTNPDLPQTITPPSLFPNISTDLFSNSSSSSTSSEETTTTAEGGNRRKRKRKWKDFFERLKKEVVEKQEELHKRFLEAIEKRDNERVKREITWRLQEMQRIKREREVLAQERSIAAAKDSAVMAFLQKFAEQQNQEQQHQQQNLVPPLNNNTNIPQQEPQATTPMSMSMPTPQQIQVQIPTSSMKQTTPVIPQAPPLTTTLTLTYQQQQPEPANNMEMIIKNDNNGESNLMQPSSSRWPKTEVEALIKMRTSLDTKYQENGPKGPLWEEISGLMKKLGYNRNAKRCKEKWENINKYFKKVKESNKKRPEDSKTCPYFHQLDALYREKNKGDSPGVVSRPEGSMMIPLMVRPEQQWPPQQQHPPLVTGTDVVMEDAENDRPHRNEEEYYDDDDEDDEGSDNYVVVANKPPPAQ